MAGKTFKNTAGDVVDIPFKMKAVVQNGTGPATSWPATLGFDSEFQVPLLDKEPNHCLIKVVAAAITDYDISLAEGEEGDASVGEAAGTACAGIVVALGEGCKRLAINDEVYCTCSGALAEYVSVAEDLVAPKPTKLTFEEAASLPIPALTALAGLSTQAGGLLYDPYMGGLCGAQNVLVIGGDSPVGTSAVQLAKAFGAAHIGATGECGGRNKLFGANTTATSEEFLKGTLSAEQKGFYHHIFDCQGGFKVWDAAHDLLRQTGTFLSINGDRDEVTSAGVAAVRDIGRKLSAAMGQSAQYARMKAFADSLADRDAKRLAIVTKLVEDGKLRPHLATERKGIYDFVEELVQDAFSHVKAGKSDGAIVVKIA